MERRKDNKGRVLKTGESQRKDLLYQYRYTDPLGKRQTVYAPTLKELRDKEDEIQRKLNEGADYVRSQITVAQLLERYLSLKQNLKTGTMTRYKYILSAITNSDFGNKQIDMIKPSDCKKWVIALSEEGKKYGTVGDYVVLVKSAFQMAVDDDILAKNPFSFKLNTVLVDNTQVRAALTERQQMLFLKFLKEDSLYSKYYDDVVVLLGTGMRIGEFCGLTEKDLDFENKRINIDHQLQRRADGSPYITTTKTKSSVRKIPMTPEVEQSLRNILVRQKKHRSVTVDGYKGFLFTTTDKNPRSYRNLCLILGRIENKFKKLYPDIDMPHITPHVLRHTFCTNMLNAGIDIKSLQYLMGHSSIDMTINRYSHSSYERVEEQMFRISKEKQEGQS